MSDEETFESADANAADCTPLKAGDLRKGSFVVMKGKPCKVRLAPRHARPRLG
jgi:translation initiation factor 5A